MRVLLVEDETDLADHLKKGLSQNSFVVDVAYEGEDGLHLATHQNYDIMILDIMLPKCDGLTILKKMREREINTPVIFLTAKDAVKDRVKGLDIGADDYVVKPFAFSELLARIRACLRRKGGDLVKTLQTADLTLDPQTRQVKRGAKKIELTQTEYSLLEYLMRNAGQIVTRIQISESVWDMNFDSFSNVVDVHIYHLRSKIDKGREKKLIHTVRGAGYVLEERD